MRVLVQNALIKWNVPLGRQLAVIKNLTVRNARAVCVLRRACGVEYLACVHAVLPLRAVNMWKVGA